MPDNTTIQENKRIDPIWRFLRGTRIALYIWLFCLIALPTYIIIKDRGNENTFLMLVIITAPILFGALFLLVQMNWERYWGRIMTRRMAAFKDPATMPIIHSQSDTEEPDLTLPLKVRLRENRASFIASLILFPIFYAVVLGSMNYSMGETGSVRKILIMTACYIIMGVLIYLLIAVLPMRYRRQSIEINEEGIKTSYLQQERSLRWDEARLFASYDADGLSKNALVRTYELSNEHTIVRWSERQGGMFRVESNQQENDDFNWLVGQINDFVMVHTALPLIDLGDQSPQKMQAHAARPRSKSGDNSNVNEEPTSTEPTVRLAQDDPWNKRYNSSSTRGALVFCSIFGLVALVGIIASQIYRQAWTHALGDGNAINMFTRLCVFFLLITLPALIYTSIEYPHIRRIQRQRQQALKQPESFLLQPQPTMSKELPQPTDLYTYIPRNKRIITTSLAGAIIGLVLYCIYLLTPSLISILGALVAALFFGALGAVAAMTQGRKKSSVQRIAVNSSGITTHYAITDAHLNWRDVRTFSTYKATHLPGFKARTQIYELAGERTVVRWSRSLKENKNLRTEPALDRDAYARWLDQLNGAIIERTGLPLLDLDRGEVK